MTTVAFTNPPASIQPADCTADRPIRFDLALADYEANSTLQLWTAPDGSDCTDLANRSGSTAICTLLDSVPLAPAVGADVSAQSLALCGDGGASAVSVQALYFAPAAATVTPSVTAVTTLKLESAPAAATTPSSMSNDDGGCAASGHAIGSSWIFVLGVLAICGLARGRRAGVRAGVGIL